MSFASISKSEKPGKSIPRRILFYVLGLFLLWLLMTLLVIPLEKNYSLPSQSMEVIRGARAYAQLVRELRPDLLTATRGLTLAHLEFKQENHGAGTVLLFGNMRIQFDQNGSFLKLEQLNSAG